MRATILIMLFFVITSSCIKRTQVEGVVYSKHGIPMPGAKISIHHYKESSYPESTEWEIATTNENGRYVIKTTTRKRGRFDEVFCNDRDSGACYKDIAYAKNNQIDLYLK